MYGSKCYAEKVLIFKINIYWAGKFSSRSRLMKYHFLFLNIITWRNFHLRFMCAILMADGRNGTFVLENFVNGNFRGKCFSWCYSWSSLPSFCSLSAMWLLIGARPIKGIRISYMMWKERIDFLNYMTLRFDEGIFMLWSLCNVVSHIIEWSLLGWENFPRAFWGYVE